MGWRFTGSMEDELHDRVSGTGEYAKVSKKGWVFAIITVVLVLALPIAFGFIDMDSLKSSPAYEKAVARAVQHTGLQAHLGKPIAVGFWVGGKLKQEGASQKADLSVDLSGPQGSGVLYIDSYAQNNAWQFQSLMFRGDKGKHIDLLK